MYHKGNKKNNSGQLRYQILRKTLAYLTKSLMIFTNFSIISDDFSAKIAKCALLTLVRTKLLYYLCIIKPKRIDYD